MKASILHIPLRGVAALLLVILGFATKPSTHAEEDLDRSAEEQAQVDENLPATETEARGRARWMHETLHGALQVMHRDFFGDGDSGDQVSLSLPSQSLVDVFKEMSRSWGVDFRWVGVNATKGDEHEPQDAFEERAAKALKEGAEEYDEIENGELRFVGAITLHNQCLKCHVPNRRTLEDRVAGLSVTIPIRNAPIDSSNSSAEAR